MRTSLAFLLAGVMVASAAAKCYCQDIFDEYSTPIRWEYERLHLRNFADYLSKDKELVGYIVVVKDKNESSGRFSERMKRIVKYLTGPSLGVNRIPKARLVILLRHDDLGQRITLQPLGKGLLLPIKGVRLNY